MFVLQGDWITLAVRVFVLQGDWITLALRVFVLQGDWITLALQVFVLQGDWITLAVQVFVLQGDWITLYGCLCCRVTSSDWRVCCPAGTVVVRTWPVSSATSPTSFPSASECFVPFCNITDIFTFSK